MLANEHSLSEIE